MLSRRDLQEYRLIRHLSLRDVARYCDVTHELIGQVERGEVGVTQYNHDEIVKGINRASQAIVDGIFEEDKEKQCQEDKLKAKAKKETSSKTTTAKRTTRKTTTKSDAK